MRSIRFFAALLAVSVVLATTAGAEPTEVGTTAAANTDTTGTPPRMATRNLFIGTNVFFEERIETSKTGQSQLLFLDESALTIASNSDVVLDKFVYDPKTSKGELALSIGAGLFRFVGGRISKTSVVTIETPTATLGIRGGIAIIKVEPGKTRAIWLFGKELTVTNDSGVIRRVTRSGFAVDVASKDEEPSSPQKVSGDEMAGNLDELEGRTGQTAGLTENLTDEQVANSGIDQVGSSNDPEDIVSEETAAIGGPITPLPLPTPPDLDIEDLPSLCPPDDVNCLGKVVAGVPVIISFQDIDILSPLSITNVTQGGNGTVVFDNGADTVTYTPNPGFFGTDTFTITTSDGGTTNVTVTGTGTFTSTMLPPPATPQSVAVLENLIDGINDGICADGTCDGIVDEVQLTVAELEDLIDGCADGTCDGIIVFTTDDTTTTTAIDTTVIVPVLANDIGDTLTITSVTQGANGTVVNNGDGTVTYTSTISISDLSIFTGTDSFTYTVSDAIGNSVTTTVNVTPVFAGRFKTVEFFDAGTGTVDGDPEFDIPFSNASIVDGFLTVTTTNGPLSLSTSGTSTEAPQGFTGFEATGTFPSFPTSFNDLVGKGFISDDETFIFYETFDNVLQFGEVFRDLIFAGIPTPASAFPNSGITAYLLEPDFVLESLIPFVRGVSGGDLQNDIFEPKTVFDVPPAPAAIDWGTGVFGGALVAIDGQGTDQTSAASLLVGSVVTGTQAEADLEGLMRGTTRVLTFEQPHLFDSVIELARDGDGNAFFGADNPDYFVFQSDGGATDDFDGIPTNSITYFPNVVAHVDTTETFGARTSRTLNGYSGGAAQLISETGVLLDSFRFSNTSFGDLTNIEIVTDATTGTVTAEFSAGGVGGSFGGAGKSAFFDDESFGAIETSSGSGFFGGSTVTNALLYLVTDVLETSGDFAAGVNFCQCEFLQWGFWGGDLDLSTNNHLRVHLANWVAGEVSSLAELSGVLGIATYTGHAIGTVINGLDVYQAVGNFELTFDFAKVGTSSGTITDFDFRNYDLGSVDLSSGVTGANVFTGDITGNNTGTISAIGTDGNFTGSFVKGGAPSPATPAEMGGAFEINDPTAFYEASGIFAGAK